MSHASQKTAKTSRKVSASASQFMMDARERNDMPPPAKKQKTKSLMSIVRPPMFDLSGIQTATQQKDVKGKTKERLLPRLIDTVAEDSLWVDKYEPNTAEELAVHKRKVQDVRQWLLDAFEGGPSGKLKKYRRILVLTGPAGTAKTATIRVLAAELGCEILEWRNAMDEQYPSSRFDDSSDWVEYESLAEKFQAFLTRAATCRPLLMSSSAHAPDSTQSTQNSQMGPSTSSSSVPISTAQSSSRRIVLLEDLPNILHAPTQASFHAALEAFVATPAADTSPLVIIISDAGLRGEGGDSDGPRWRSRDKEAMDVRNVLPSNLLSSPYVMQISFNPIAVTYMRAALKTLLDRHFTSSTARAGTRPSKEVVDVVVESSNGDIRSAIMALQFACTASQGHLKPSKGAKKGAKSQGVSAAVMLESVTRREQSLALFHLLGKIMYNKRKGDPPPQSASAKDIRRDKEIDAGLKNPPPLPPHLSHHERKASRVDVEMLYGDTPIDASLLSLYIHQNYTQYCDSLDECEALMDSLSWVDASGGEMWYQSNPHQFHLVTLGTLHALPSPVPRRNQKSFKPAFFETLQRQHEAEDAVRDVQAWLQRGHLPLSCWSPRDVAMGVGTVLRLGESSGKFAERVPPTHRLFSKLEFARESGSLAELAEDGDATVDPPEVERDYRPRVPTILDDDRVTGASLSDDEIEDW